MSELVEHLRSFNRKERFILLRHALGAQTFRLDEGFARRLGHVLDLTIHGDAFVAMDYHLDWLQAALEVAERPYEELPIADPKRELVEANQRDADLLVAFEQGPTTHVVLLEAKVETSWTNSQLRPKVERLRRIFGDSPRTNLATPHFVLLSPHRPQKIASADWPPWMKPGGRPLWMPLPRPALSKVTRCDVDGEPSREGSFFSVDAVPPSGQGLDDLAAFLPLVQDSGFVFGTSEGGEEVEPGTFTMPWFSMSEPARRLVETSYENGWVLADFDWPEWMGTAEARRLRDDRTALALASIEQVARLLTVLIRQDRFVEGTLAEAFETGLLTAILRRVEQLRLASTAGSVDA